MRNIMLLSLFLVLLHAASAQTNGFSLSASVGPAMPLGKFAGKNVDEKGDGFAKTGIAANITANYRITKTLGLTFMLSGQQNSVNTNAAAEQIQKQATLVLISPLPPSVAIMSKSWQMGKFMAGGNIALPLNSKTWLFTARLLGGVLKTTQPQVATFVREADGYGTTVYFGRAKQPLPWAFTALAGAGMQYNLSPKIFLTANLDYCYAAPKAIYPDFTGYITLSASSGPIPIPTTPPAYNHSLASANFTLGAGINLAK